MIQKKKRFLRLIYIESFDRLGQIFNFDDFMTLDINQNYLHTLRYTLS
jgi:hypothetical protein